MRLLLLLSCLFLSLPTTVQARELRIALGAHYQAVEVPVGGQRGGLSAFNEDLAQAICRRLNARCFTVNVKFGEILPGVAAGEYQLGFGNFLRTPEREMQVAFSDPIWRSSSRLVATSATAQRFAAEYGADSGLDKLRNARIVAVPETQQYRYLQALAGPQDLTLLSVATYVEAFTLLREGRADFALLPMLSAYPRIAQAEAGTFEFFGAPEAGRGLGGTVHIALPKSDTVLYQAVNKAIAALRADGTYHRIVRRYFPFSLE
ncbi:MAG: hypothetical protein CVU16_07815 [Betaproteobacteria bacterium HGW-Betaproteobacteria-10]|nr:MAG: hypothetical protein CVU16_07815 [Betaproteobacteria bacterium HGW-Betaproteobacteria-10]